MNFDKYIGLPYRHKGRDFDGVDCYGLCYLIFKNEIHTILPDFINIKYSPDWYRTGKNFILNELGTFDKNIWLKVNKPFKVYDGLIFYLSSKTIANHCGLYIGNNKFIHIYENTTSQIERLDSSFVKLYGAIRYIDQHKDNNTCL